VRPQRTHLEVRRSQLRLSGSTIVDVSYGINGARTQLSVTVPIRHRCSSVTSAISIAPASMLSIASRTVAPGATKILSKRAGSIGCRL